MAWRLIQDVTAELGEDLGDLAEKVVAVGTGEGSQVLAVPAPSAVICGGGPVGQRRHFGGESRVQEEWEGEAAVAAEIADPVRRGVVPAAGQGPSRRGRRTQATADVRDHLLATLRNGAS